MSTKPRICCLTKNKINPAYVGALIGGARLAKHLGCDFEGLAPETPDDLDQQIALLEQAIYGRPDAILISPVHASKLDASLQRALDAGIVLVYFVSSSDQVPARSFVTSNNYTLAYDIAERLFEALGGKGRVAIIEGLNTSPTSAPRTDGFLAAARTHPDVEIIASVAGNYQYALGRSAMADILARHMVPNGVLAANDFMALGALDVLDDHGMTAAVVGMNAVPDAIAAIKDGRLFATVSYDALSLVCVAVEAAVRILRGESVPALIELPAEIVDAGNCGAWDMPYEERPLPVWQMAIGSSLG